MPRRLSLPNMPTLPTLALAAAVALLALAAAHAFWRVAAPLPIAAPAAVAAPAGLAHPGLDALFGNASPTAPAARGHAGALRLIGVIAAGEAGGVALIAADGQPVRAYRRGDALAGSGGAARVGRIEARRVHLSDGGELTLPAAVQR